MDGVGITIIERPRSLHNYDTPNPAHNTYTLKCEEPVIQCGNTSTSTVTTPIGAGGTQRPRRPRKTRPGRLTRDGVSLASSP